MADKKISELNSLTGAGAANGDLVAIVDVSATETKKITRSEFFTDTPSIDVSGTVTATGLDLNGDADFGGQITLSRADFTTLKRNDNTGYLSILGGDSSLSTSIVMYGNAHDTLPNRTVIDADTMLFRPVDNSPEFLRFEDGTGAVFNENSADLDFRIESDTYSHAFFLQGSDGYVGINTSTPEAPLTINPGNTATTSIGGRDISYGVNTIVSSGRTGYLCRVLNNYTAPSDNAGFQWIYPFDTGGNANNKVFRSSTGATLVDKFWVNQAGGGYFASDVGIGTSGPQANLDVTGESGNQLVVATDTNAANTEAGILFKHHTTGSNYDGGGIRSIRNATNNDFSLAFDVGRNGVSTEAMFISGSDATGGNVGIGTSSPSARLEVADTDGASGIEVSAYRNDTTYGNSYIKFNGPRSSTTDGNTTDGRGAITLLGNSSGLQGSLWINAATATLLPDTADEATMQGYQAGLNLNSDGELSFWDNGSQRFLIDSSGHAIIPGGVTLGTAAGTYNAANTLDDYEEGEWTPEYAGQTNAGAFTYDIQVGHYTKIGRLVTVSGRLRTDSASGATGNAQIIGLPFSVRSTSTEGVSGCGSIGEVGNFDTEYPIGLYANSTSSTLYITTQLAVNGVINKMNAANGFLDAANANGLFFSCTYQTDE